jgi:hypothetical protein
MYLCVTGRFLIIQVYWFAGVLKQRKATSFHCLLISSGYSAGGNKTTLYVHTVLVAAAVCTILMGNDNDNITVRRHRIDQGWEELRIKINYMVTNIYIYLLLNCNCALARWQCWQNKNIHNKIRTYIDTSTYFGSTTLEDLGILFSIITL